MQAGKDGAVARRPAPKPNEFYKISLCKHFLQGECPFGDGCHFAHGESELRRLPGKGGNSATQPTGEGAEITDNMFGNTENTTVDYFQGGAAGGGKPSPILEPELAAFFIVRAADQRDLAVSTVKGEWYVQRKHAEKMNAAYNGGKQVMVFFTVSDSEHIQGAALVTSMATQQESVATHETGDDEKDAAKGDGPFSYRFKCEWYRTTELPISTAVEACPDLLLPTRQTQYCQDMTSTTGEGLMKAVWNSPLVTLYEGFSGDQEPPKEDAILTDFRCPPPEQVSWPTAPGPGFIFGCNSQTMDECLGRGVLGLPTHMKGAASCIKPGSFIFLYNVTDRLLFGIFEALTPARSNIVPTAFSKNPKATTSPFPIQIRVRVSLECPPVEDTDPILNEILRTRVGGRIGPLTHAQAEALASLMANQCGALQYMLEYQRNLRFGNYVQAPPIALPPRKIQLPKVTKVENNGGGGSGGGDGGGHYGPGT